MEPLLNQIIEHSAAGKPQSFVALRQIVEWAGVGDPDQIVADHQKRHSELKTERVPVIDDLDLVVIIGSSARSDKSLDDALIRKLAIEANVDPDTAVANHKRIKKEHFTGATQVVV